MPRAKKTAETAETETRPAAQPKKPEPTHATVRDATFVLAEFVTDDAELYDAYYAEHGGQELSFELQMLRVRYEQVPSNRVVEFLEGELKPLLLRLEARKKVYAETRDPALFDEIVSLSEQVDALQARVQTALKDFDFERFFRLRGELQGENVRLRVRLADLRLGFCHRLAVSRGLTALTPETWREGATSADREAAEAVVKKVLSITAPSADSPSGPEEQTNAPSAPPASGTLN